MPSSDRRPQAGFPSGAPYIPDSTSNFAFYDPLNYTTNRAQRPFFATDSKFTLTAWSRLRGMALARWAYINVPFIKGAVDLNAYLTMGTGFTPKSHCKDEGLAKAYDEYYLEKTESIGFMLGESMDDLLIYDSRGADVDGDLGYIMVDDEFGEPRLQLIEGHRIKNGDVSDSRCRDGVWTDRYGRATHYNILLPGENEKTTPIPVQNFIYMAERNRPDEVRSMTNLLHALNPLQDLYEILGFAMQTAKKNSEYAAHVYTDTPGDLPFGPNYQEIMRAMNGNPPPDQPQNTPGPDIQQPGAPQQRVRFEQVWASGGKIPILRPNEKLQYYEHHTPPPEIAAWAEFIIRGIAVGMGRPYEILWNPEKIGGANTRLITALVKMRDRQRRRSFVYPKLRRVRYWILSKGIKRRELKFDPDITRCTWNPNFADISTDAGRDRREARADVMAGLDTYTGFYRDGGADYRERELPARETDFDAQCAAAQRAVAKYPGLTFETALSHIALITANANENRSSGGGGGQGGQNE